MLLDDIVAGACRDVVAVRPNSGSWIVRKEWPLERVAVIRAKWIGPGANRIAHIERSFGVTGGPSKNRQHVKPPLGELVIADHRISAGLRLALASESFEDR